MGRVYVQCTSHRFAPPFPLRAAPPPPCAAAPPAASCFSPSSCACIRRISSTAAASDVIASHAGASSPTAARTTLAARASHAAAT
eukprot:3912297-Prymnesium_polylepis.1